MQVLLSKNLDKIYSSPCTFPILLLAPYIFLFRACCDVILEDYVQQSSFISCVGYVDLLWGTWACLILHLFLLSVTAGANKLLGKDKNLEDSSILNFG